MRTSSLALRLKMAAVALPFAGAVACDLPEPSDAYDSIVLDTNVEGTAIDAGREDAGMNNIPDTSVGTGGMAGGMAGGMGGTDAGSDPALAKIKGRYLMRMDLVSDVTVTITAGFLYVKSKNLVSYLMVTEIGDNGSSTERMCHQTFRSTCTEGCATLETNMVERVTDKLVMYSYPRTYQLSASNMLTAGSVTMSLGYDGRTDMSLPSSGDARVWDILSGAPAEGMLTNLKSTGTFAVECSVYNAQKFVTTFQGSAAPTGENPLGGTFKLSTTGSESNVLGSSDSRCIPKSAPDETVRSKTVRFSPANSIDQNTFWNCPPPSVWDTALPGPVP